jgi:type III secretion system YscD/HrpQ family protein
MHDTSDAPSPVRATWCLRFLSGALRGRSIALKPGANIVGSAADCDVMLPGGDVQPRHLQLTVGALVLSVQRLGDAAASLNGEEMPAQRRSVMAGDVLTIGGIDFQLDRAQPVAVPEEAADSMFVGTEEAALAAAEAAPRAAATRHRGRWLGGGAAVAGLVAVLGFASWDASGTRPRASETVDLQAVQRVLAGFPEVEAVAGADGSVALRGYVESRTRKLALRQAIEPFGARTTLAVLSAEEIVEQARRFINDPGVSIAYGGKGRLLVSGSSEDIGLRRQLRRLAEDLHPAVLVSDKVQYVERTATRDESAEQARAQWAAWQNVLPARMVGITEDAHGLRHIQLANGSRYYEGSVLPSGAELKRIDADGLVLSGATPPATKERKQ